jgi:acetylornithine deacetylase/succinyl-diaminopimelate desuccinylase-like protein
MFRANAVVIGLRRAYLVCGTAFQGQIMSMKSRLVRTLFIVATASAAALPAQPVAQAPDWSAIEAETLRHFQALLRFDTSDPPGTEKAAVDYLRQVLEREGIAVQTFALPNEPHRPNLVARLRGSGARRPILIMGHTDVVNVDTTKWTHPPFSATRDDGYVYGRGAVDDKDNVAAGLMIMLMLKRQNVPLDRDVIFLAESGEEGSTRVGIQFMANEHYDALDAEYCLAEGGAVVRAGGRVKYAGISTTEKIPRAIELTAIGPAGHGSVPLRGNAVVQLSQAIAKFATWRSPIELNETTRAYFQRLAGITTGDSARRYRDIISGDPARIADADEYFLTNEPAHASIIRTSISPNIVQGGYRVNVIPSEAKATLDVRMVPGTDTARFLETIRRVVDNPAITVAYARRDVRPETPFASLDSEAFRVIEAAVTQHYQTVTLPTMLTGATDMAYLRAKGMQCYGMGPAMDAEDGPKGFGAHSDQERILESELHRFVRFQWDVVTRLAGRRSQP